MDLIGYEQGKLDRKYAKIKHGEIIKKNPFREKTGAYSAWLAGWDEQDKIMAPSEPEKLADQKELDITE
mgnify:CR=1 FL=1